MSILTNYNFIHWLYFILTYVCFLSFWHSSLVVFKRDDKQGPNKSSWKVKWLSILVWNSLPLHYLFYAKPILGGYAELGLLMSTLSLFIYWSSVKTISHKKFSVIFSNEEPHFIHKQGLYKYIRHPFYTSYIICYIGVVIAVPSVVSFVLSFLTVLLYVIEAKKEESNFLKSSLSTDYINYQKTTGMILPRLFK